MEKPYSSLVTAIQLKPMTTKVAAMTLINTLINHASSMDDRIRLRNYFASLVLSEVVEQVSERASAKAAASAPPCSLFFALTRE